MSCVVGVDGGGTRTRAVVVDERGVELGRADAAGSVATAEAPEDAARTVLEAVHGAAEHARVALPAAALWAGLAGAGRPAARDAVQAALSRSGLAQRVCVGTDVEAAFHSAFGDGPGLLLIAGTGSIAWGRGRDGRVVRVGGWGLLLGDEGSGYAIGLEALREVLRADDGRAPETRMKAPILERCGVQDAEALVGWVGSASKADVAGLVPIVSEAAARLDAAAMSIVEGAAVALDTHVGALLQRMGTAADVLPLVLWGGLLSPGGPLRASVRQLLQNRAVVLTDAEVDPALGAARLASALLSDR